MSYADKYPVNFFSQNIPTVHSRGGSYCLILKLVTMNKSGFSVYSVEWREDNLTGLGLKLWSSNSDFVVLHQCCDPIEDYFTYSEVSFEF